MQIDIKRIGIICNPISGKGRSCLIAGKISEELQLQGFTVDLFEIAPGLTAEIPQSLFEQNDLLIIAGGDGTLMRLLSKLSESSVPVYMLPTGNESLFAREFGMTLCSKKLLNSISLGRVSRHYLAAVNDQLFFTMVSLGFDSQVIKHLAQVRKGTISHLLYLPSILKSALGHHAPCIDLKVDNKICLNSESGLLIIANNKQYAMRLPFVPEACSSDSELVARFFPYKGILGFLACCLRTYLRSPSIANYSKMFKGKILEIKVKGEPYPLQADGEYVGNTPALVVADKCMIKVLISK